MAQVITPQPSDLDGRHLTYVDRLLMRHAGFIVGQSTDGQTYFVQSDNGDLKPMNWDFTVSKRIVDKLLD